MDSAFWHQRWEKNEIAFHEGEANRLLVKYFDRLSLSPQSRVFLPLCGKTLDIHWLLAQGYRLAGAELSSLAIEQLFVELGLVPKVSEMGKLARYSAENIDIFVGDILDLSASMLGEIDAVYDRAALVALPQAMRSRYARHLMEMTQQASQLLICFEYDASRMPGPPFSIPREEVQQLYRETYEITLLADVEMPGGLKGIPAQEQAWLLKKR